MQLSELKTYQKATILSIENSQFVCLDEIENRLLKLGITRGMQIEIINRGILSNSSLVAEIYDGYNLKKIAIGYNEAKSILVKII